MVADNGEKGGNTRYVIFLGRPDNLPLDVVHEAAPTHQPQPSGVGGGVGLTIQNS